MPNNFRATDIDLRSVKIDGKRYLPNQDNGSPGAAMRPITAEELQKHHTPRVGFLTSTSHEFKPAMLELVGPPQRWTNDDKYGESIAYTVKRPDKPELDPFRVIVSAHPVFDKIDVKQTHPIVRKLRHGGKNFIQVKTGNVWAVLNDESLTPQQVRDGKQSVIAAHNGGWVRHKTIGDGYIGVKYNEWYKMAAAPFEKLYRPNNDLMEKVSQLWKTDLGL